MKGMHTIVNIYFKIQENTVFERNFKKAEKCIPNKGCGFLFIEASF